MANILNKAPILCRVFHKTITFGPLTKITFVKNCGHFTNRTNIRAEQRFRLSDNISNDYKLIYREQRMVEIVAMTAYNGGWLGFAFGVFTAAYLIYKDPPIVKDNINLRKELKLTKLGMSIMLYAGIVMCIVSIIASRKLPLRIYHNSTEKLYKVILVNNIFDKKHVVTFSERTATPRFQWFSGLYKINGHTILLDRESFPVQSVFEQMVRKTS